MITKSTAFISRSNVFWLFRNIKTLTLGPLQQFYYKFSGVLNGMKAVFGSRSLSCMYICEPNCSQAALEPFVEIIFTNIS